MLDFCTFHIYIGQGFFICHIKNYTGYNQKWNVRHNCIKTVRIKKKMWPLLQKNCVIFIEFWRKNDLGFQNKKSSSSTVFNIILLFNNNKIVLFNNNTIVLFNNNKIVLFNNNFIFLLNIVCYKINVYFKLMLFFWNFYSSKNSEKKKHSNNFQKIYIYWAAQLYLTLIIIKNASWPLWQNTFLFQIYAVLLKFLFIKEFWK